MEKHVIVLWLNGNPIIDGAYYFDTREDALNHFKSLPKVEGVEITYTICRIVKHKTSKSE